MYGMLQIVYNSNCPRKLICYFLNMFMPIKMCVSNVRPKKLKCQTLSMFTPSIVHVDTIPLCSAFEKSYRVNVPVIGQLVGLTDISV